MARPADDYSGSPTTEVAVVLTPEGKQWLLARAAWLASEPGNAGWDNEGQARGVAELSQLNAILSQAITTEELPPRSPAWSSSATR